MTDPSSSPNPLRSLPPVSALLADPRLADIAPRLGRQAVLDAIRATLEEARNALLDNQLVDTSHDALIHRVLARLDQHKPTLRRVLNATGILLHTGLGRAPLAPHACAAILNASGPCNLEFNLESGERGHRSSHIEPLLARLTGAPAAFAVNNNAAATLLALHALATGREVLVSRGQLVEIGGSYRLPEIFTASGARLREVGTTNKTRLADYAAAISPETALILRVHASNYRIVGFTQDVPIADLARLAHEHGLPAIDDIGSGALAPGLPRRISPLEPTIRASLEAGADLVLASGDKLLGGPQCGLILGRADLVNRLKANPLARACRLDKLRLAALEATLLLAADPDLAHAQIPLWTMLSLSLDQLEARGQSLVHALRESGFIATLEPASAYVGGGSLPDEAIPSIAIRLDPPYPGSFSSPGRFAHALRTARLPLVGRIQDNALWLDLRSLALEPDHLLLNALRLIAQPDPAPHPQQDPHSPHS
jgi:L-seryl-tRNA(Ser) seleniumtransferase